ncbi:MAG: single-stranded-DNA-specific exonuclease RecJ [Kofleriaceae bacterium]
MDYRVRRADERTIAQLARGLGLREPAVRALIGRGVADLEAARRFLTPRLGALRPPVGLAGFERGVTRVAQAVQRGERIGVFGDYDVDGVTTAALLTSFLRAAGAEVEVAVAHRDEGYGFTPAVATALLDRGAQLLLVGDCGTSDLDAIDLARSRAVDVVIIDHHTVPEAAEHPAHALINPYAPRSAFPFRGMASVGLAFYVASAVRTALRGAGYFATRAEPDVRELLDLVALGTIADLVPLVEENRILVAHGLRRLSARARPGVSALLAQLKLAADEPVTEKLVSWRLAPRLNAPGRLGPAEPALAALLADATSAPERAAALEAANEQRRAIQDRIYEEALELLGAEDPGPVVVVGKEGWPAGVVGILAAKLVDRWQRPAFVVGASPGAAIGRGSARTVEGIDLYQVLRGAADKLERFGGHAAAAGFSVRVDRPGWLEELRGALGHAAAELAKGSGPVSTTGVDPLEIDAEVPLAQLTPRVARELDQLAPFGQANPAPRLAVRGAIVVSRRWVGDGSHLQVTLGDGKGAERRAIWFRAGEGALAGVEDGDRVDAVFTPSLSVWNGRERVELEIVELGPARPAPLVVGSVAAVADPALAAALDGRSALDG